MKDKHLDSFWIISMCNLFLSVPTLYYPALFRTTTTKYKYQIFLTYIHRIIPFNTPLHIHMTWADGVLYKCMYNFTQQSPYGDRSGAGSKLAPVQITSGWLLSANGLHWHLLHEIPAWVTSKYCSCHRDRARLLSNTILQNDKCQKGSGHGSKFSHMFRVLWKIC